MNQFLAQLNTPFDPQALSTDVIWSLLRDIGAGILSLWWIWVLLILGAIFRGVWLRWRRNLYQLDESMVTLEVRISREIVKGPKAMESIFASINGLASAPDTIPEIYWDGEVTRRFSFEIASFGGDIRFFVHVPKKLQNVVEAHIYAHYPDVEIVEPEDDYVNRMPSSLKGVFEEGYDLFGSELVLGKEDVFPIRTYTEFESMEDAQNLDPIAALIENLAKLKPEEHMWFQVVVRPLDRDWAEEGRKMVEKLREKEITKEKVKKADGTYEERMTRRQLSPGEVEQIKAVERNIAKPGFDVVIRYIYFAPREMFNLNFAKRSVFSSLNQYKSEALNYFKKNSSATTLVDNRSFPFIFVERRKNTRKANELYKYRERYMPVSKKLSNAVGDAIFGEDITSRTITLNTEELATIYHYPTETVLTAPFMQRVESRRIGPPAGLPIFTGNEDHGFVFGEDDEGD